MEIGIEGEANENEEGGRGKKEKQRTSSLAHSSSSPSILYIGGTTCTGILTNLSLNTNPTCFRSEAEDESAGFSMREEMRVKKGCEGVSFRRR
jgi:hypothetical protein